MNDLVRTENLLGGNKTIVGSPSADLILESLGKVYIKYGKSIQLLDKVIKGISSSSEESIIITSSNDIEYPGDGKLVYNTTNFLLSICIDGELIPLIEASGKEGAYVKKSGDRMSGTLYLDNKKPLNVTSTSLIQNLNSEYVGGYKEEDLAKKHEDEIIDGRWTFDELQRFKKKVVIDQSIGTDLYQDGYQGFGWRIDSKSNTLTIDNIIVRKAMYVYELVVNKIRATNGTLWITNSATLEEALSVSNDLNSASWHFSEDKTKVVNKGVEYPIHTEQNEKLWTESINYIADYLDYKDKLTNFESTGTYQTYKIYNKFFANSTGYYVIQTDETVFLEGDLLRCQKVVNHGIKYYEAVVITTISFDQYLIQLSESSQFYTDVNSDDKLDMFPQKTDVVVQFGNIFNKNRQGSFFITSTEENSPYAMVIADCNRPNYNEPYASPIFNGDGTLLQVDSKYKYEWIKSVKVRLGKLDKQWDNFYLDEYGESTIKGWGLYGQDVYLTGEFHLNNGQTIVDFAQDGILLKFKNAGLEIKDITVTQNGWKVQMYGTYPGNQRELDPSLIEFQNGVPTYYTYSGVKYLLQQVNSYYQADCNIDEENWFITVSQGESTWNGGSSNKQGIVLTADQVMITNPRDNQSMSMFTFTEDNKAVFNTDLIVAGEIICKNTISSKYTFDFDSEGQLYKFSNLDQPTAINPLWALYDEGHGMLAGGNIRWQKNGELDIRGTIHADSGDIAGIYLMKCSEKPYKYLRTENSLFGSGMLVLNNNFWKDRDGDGVTLNATESGVVLDANGDDDTYRVGLMWDQVNGSGREGSLGLWLDKLYFLKQNNYQFDSNSSVANVMPYSNGILINKFGIKQKLNNQILSFDSTILHLNYTPVTFEGEENQISLADASYQGYLNGACIGVYNYNFDETYNTDDGTHIIVIALDDVINKNPELCDFLIEKLQGGNIQIKIQYSPVLLLDKNKKYAKPQYGSNWWNEGDVLVNTGNGYGEFKYWQIQNFINATATDAEGSLSGGFYRGYKSDQEESNKYKWESASSTSAYGIPMDIKAYSMKLDVPSSALQRLNPDKNFITQSINLYGYTPSHNLYSGKKFYTTRQKFACVSEFRFKSPKPGYEYKYVGNQDPYIIDLTKEVVFNKVAPDTNCAVIGYADAFITNTNNYSLHMKRNSSSISTITGANKTYTLSYYNGSYYTPYTLTQQDYKETIENYIIIRIGDDASANYGGFSLQIVYNE